ncbi:MAG: methyltransferase domain-containing protein [Candidatus Marinimicrobia bacterium]|nr:methyltransferase domain-containing protein [Candidatus Neomarinimicrobiota bacterium]
MNPKCSVCGSPLESVIKLPEFPLTGIYSKSGQDSKFRNYDQELLLCTACGHAQIKNIIDVNFMYGDTYGFRTSASETASGGSQYFSRYIDTLFPGRVFKSIVDLGCNDGYLLKLFKQENKSKQYLGVDLIWKDNPQVYKDGEINFSGDKIESIDFSDFLDDYPELVVSQHTLEHIEDPKALLESLFLKTGDETIFVFEFPCFDPLLENLRFDQVFHQHLQYFSVQSFLHMLGLLDAVLIDYTINYNYWGALIIAFKKRAKSTSANNPIVFNPEKSMAAIQDKYQSFKNQMAITAEILNNLENEVWYGYGAALMLPILGYHLGTDFSNFKNILDNDPQKAGLGYINLPVKIQQPGTLDFSAANILLTALDNRLPILNKLNKHHPKRILNPLMII